MRANKVDKNHAEIRDAMREHGATVIDTSSLKNFVDLVVGFHGVTALIEIKSSSKARFTESQLKLIASWRGGILARIEDVDSAIRLLKTMEKI
jgi:Holliday junction resolvase